MDFNNMKSIFIFVSLKWNVFYDLNIIIKKRFLSIGNFFEELSLFTYLDLESIVNLLCNFLNLKNLYLTDKSFYNAFVDS